MMSAGDELNSKWQDGTVKFQCESGDEDRIAKSRQENRCDNAVQIDIQLDPDHRGEDDSMEEIGSELR